ncbi:ribonuclease R [Bartonella bacilliformis Peru38]|uniref:Ribonuclease R n=2 Tax=Bartonella bacilliformis TaxID=774 RepID=A1UT29_BARBK|nr:ribonuclease R [Bartonella bacilliformis]ABM45112.1 ribonuclease R [Bartonella bacilliformis KC583]AMG85922.1 ribonuclease R [Bartonella bacilliformis]EKS43868.1 exoribonuclease [Bartonella bacilliformis INS]EYS89863.1 ribonuclease R [Bartonella bacilliformis San Pedro600-02]EYS95206.1 ribonuclease R [Bartonella bacilliformis Peru-18]
MTKKKLPSVTVAKINTRNKDGGFIAHPLKWESDTKPNIEIFPPRHMRNISFRVGDHILIKIFRNKNFQITPYTGRIVRKIDEKETKTLGIIRKLENGKWQFSPIERKIREFIIDEPSDINIKSGNLVEIEIKNTNCRFKSAKITNVLGYIDSEKTLAMISLISKGIPYIFPEDVLEQAKNIKPANTINREDWRHLPFITIDPPDAKDHDDAVYAIKDEDPTNSGGWIIIVAIADVSYYIKTGSALDKEALQRGNSVYFPDRVVPMLPETISNHLCSLREGEDRFSLAVRMVFDANGNKRKHSFHRIVMRTAAKLSYQEVQCAIEGNTNEKTAPLIENILQPLWSAYTSLKIARDLRQPLELEISEKKVILDQNGCIKDVVRPPHLEAHRLIEEFMIQANVSAAETLKKHRQSFIYRIHDEPSLTKQETLRNSLHNFKIPLSSKVKLTSKQLNNILTTVTNTQQQELINQIILRSQSQAEYNPKNIGHFGLNLQNYAHFTSPIRRYADLIVHRALIKALQLGDDGLTDEQEQNLVEIATQISSYERRAMMAERETIDRLVAHYLADKIGHLFKGRISGVTKAGLFISLDKLNADGFVPISTLKNDYYHFDEEQHALIGKHSYKYYQLGDAVEIKLVEVQPFAGALCFEILTEPQLLTSSSLSYHKTKSTMKRRKCNSYKRKV